MQRDSCPWSELSLSVDAADGTAPGAICIKLTTVPVPDGYPSKLQQDLVWPQPPHPATRPRATVCRWSAEQLLQFTLGSPAVAPHCAFAVSGPFISERRAWGRLLAALRAPGDPKGEASGQESGTCGAGGGGGAPGSPRRAAAARQEQGQQRPFGSVLVMRVAGLHIDAHIKLLLIPSHPPSGGPPVLLGYLLLSNWHGPGCGGPSVAVGCGVTMEEARRCMTASSRSNVG